MRSHRTPTAAPGHFASRWRRGMLAVASCAVAALALTVVRVGGDLNAMVHRPPSIESSFIPRDESAIIIAGTGSRRGEPFYLAGGTYRVTWSAWGAAPEYPPCSHSAELRAIDAASATSSSGHVADVAKLVSVPATGASDERYVANIQPGNYYVDVASACAWQIAVSRIG